MYYSHKTLLPSVDASAIEFFKSKSIRKLIKIQGFWDLPQNFGKCEFLNFS